MRPCFLHGVPFRRRGRNDQRLLSSASAFGALLLSPPFPPRLSPASVEASGAYVQRATRLTSAYAYERYQTPLPASALVHRSKAQRNASAPRREAEMANQTPHGLPQCCSALTPPGNGGLGAPISSGAWLHSGSGSTTRQHRTVHGTVDLDHTGRPRAAPPNTVHIRAPHCTRATGQRAPRRKYRVRTSDPVEIHRRCSIP